MTNLDWQQKLLQEDKEWEEWLDRVEQQQEREMIQSEDIAHLEQQSIGAGSGG